MLDLSKCGFVKSAASKQDFLTDHPQVVFLGRSNVGKSSLINSLCNRKKLVYVSATPGRTKLISYFSIEDKAYLVDAPGYGFFKDGALDFEKMMLEYLSLGPKLIRRAYLLLDSRRESLSKNDAWALDYLKKSGLEVRLVFTKYDKLGMKEKANLQKLVKSLGDDLVCYYTSSEKRSGMEALIKDVQQALK